MKSCIEYYQEKKDNIQSTLYMHLIIYLTYSKSEYIVKIFFSQEIITRTMINLIKKLFLKTNVRFNQECFVTGAPKSLEAKD